MTTKTKAVEELNVLTRILKTEPAMVITVAIAVVSVVSGGLSGHWDFSAILGVVELAGGLGIRSQVYPAVNTTTGAPATVSEPSAAAGGGMGAGTAPTPVA